MEQQWNPERNYPQSRGQSPAPTQNAPSSKGGCMGALMLLLLVLVGVMAIIRHCDKSLKSPEFDTSPVTPVGTGPSPVVASASTSAESTIEAGPPSAFDAAWSLASDVGETRFEDVLALTMTKQSYCHWYKCGDEFSRDQAWGAAREVGTRIQATMWRAEVPAARTSFLGTIDTTGGGDKRVPGFLVEDWVPERNEFPISIVWPIDLGGIKCATSRLQILPFINGAGNDERKWAQIDSRVLSAHFPSTDAAKAWRTDPGSALGMHLLFRVTGGVYDTWKADSVYDFGAKGLVTIKLVGVQLRDRGRVIGEKADPVAKK
jgi:hypothetical protein